MKDARAGHQHAGPVGHLFEAIDRLAKRLLDVDHHQGGAVAREQPGGGNQMGGGARPHAALSANWR